MNSTFKGRIILPAMTYDPRKSKSMFIDYNFKRNDSSHLGWVDSASPSRSMFQDYICYNTGTSQVKINVADGLCSPQHSKIFLSASLQFLHSCLEKRLFALKSESSQCRKSISNSNSLYSYGNMMACLNGKKNRSMELLQKLPTSTQYEDKVKNWSSSLQNTSEKTEDGESLGRVSGANNHTFSIFKMVPILFKSNSRVKTVNELKSAPNVKERQCNKSQRSSNKSRTNKRDHSLFPSCENNFNKEQNTVDSEGLFPIKESNDKQSQSECDLRINSNKCKSLISMESICSKLSYAFIQLTRQNSKLNNENDSVLNFSEEKVNEELVANVPDEKDKIKPLKRSKFSMHKLKEHKLNNIKQKKESQKKKNKELSPKTTKRLQKVFLKLFKSKKKTKYSEYTTVITSDSNATVNKLYENKIKINFSDPTENKKSDYKQTSQVLIGVCTNSESQTSNSYISVTESGIEKLLAQSYLQTSRTSLHPEQMNVENKIKAKRTKLKSLKTYRMPHMVACSKCKKVYYSKKYKNAATSTDDNSTKYEISIGCPHCRHCSPSGEPEEVSYVSQTVSKTFETKMGVGSDDKVKTAFSWESHNSSRTTLYMEHLQNDNAFHSKALSRILKEIIREQKGVFRQKADNQIESFDSSAQNNKIKNNINDCNFLGSRNTPTVAFRQLSKLSICDDQDLNIFSDYEVPTYYAKVKNKNSVKTEHKKKKNRRKTRVKEKTQRLEQLKSETNVLNDKIINNLDIGRLSENYNPPCSPTDKDIKVTEPKRNKKINTSKDNERQRKIHKKRDSEENPPLIPRFSKMILCKSEHLKVDLPDSNTKLYYRSVNNITRSKPALNLTKGAETSGQGRVKEEISNSESKANASGMLPPTQKPTRVQIQNSGDARSLSESPQEGMKMWYRNCEPRTGRVEQSIFDKFYTFSSHQLEFLRSSKALFGDKPSNITLKSRCGNKNNT